MISNTAYDAIIFDMDGLMFDTERIGYDAFVHASKLHGYIDKTGFFKTLIGMNVPDADIAIKGIFGGEFPIAKVREERSAYMLNIRNTTGIPVKLGLKELLNYLKSQNILMGVASSSSRHDVEQNLDNADLQNYFSCLFCGDEVVNGKPDPEIYLKTAKQLSVTPSRCVVLEDSSRGLQAAYAAGMIPIMVPDMQKPTDEDKKRAYRVLLSLKEVKKHLEEIDVNK